MSGLNAVLLSWEVCTACLGHALGNENEEVLGLLLGQVDSESGIATIKRSVVLQRKDKKSDRVEVGYENLAIVSTMAEKVSIADIETTGDLNVLGWYHSHPHITVVPSHVDVKTQGSYQMLDHGFVGLIFSCFDSGKFEVCAFQSRRDSNDTWHRVEIPISLSLSIGGGSGISNCGKRPQIQLPSKISLETLLALQKALLNEDLESLIELYKGFTSSAPPSSAFVSRACLALQSSIMRRIDIQIIPLQMATQSKKASMIMERDRLRLKLKLLQSQRGGGEEKVMQRSYVSQSSINVEEVQNALELTSRTWRSYSESFRCLMLDGLQVQIIDCSCTKFAYAMDGTKLTTIRIRPFTYRVNTLHSIYYSCPVSPWILEFGCFWGYIIDTKALIFVEGDERMIQFELLVPECKRSDTSNVSDQDQQEDTEGCSTKVLYTMKVIDSYRVRWWADSDELSKILQLSVW